MIEQMIYTQQMCLWKTVWSNFKTYIINNKSYPNNSCVEESNYISQIWIGSDKRRKVIQVSKIVDEIMLSKSSTTKIVPPDYNHNNTSMGIVFSKHITQYELNNLYNLKELLIYNHYYLSFFFYTTILYQINCLR